MTSLIEILAKLQEMETQASGDASIIQQIEESYEALAPQAESAIEFLLQRNAFRIANWEHLATRKIRILMGMINNDVYPNFHTAPLLQVADVVSVTSCDHLADRVDRISFDLVKDGMPQIAERLPKGWQPDFYWDPKICGASVPIKDMEQAPFPTIASYTHHNQVLSLDNLTRIYDIISPLSRKFTELISAKHADKGYLNVPFGLNSGSFHHILQKSNETKDIDILITFGDKINPVYGPYRKKCHDIVNAFEEKYPGRFNIVRISGLGKDEYLHHVRRSKIAINAVAEHGPTNYRTFEIINSGTCLFQIRTNFSTDPQYIEDYFDLGKEIELFDERDFEEKALKYLDDDQLLNDIISKASNKMESQYSYKQLYQELIHQFIEMANGPLMDYVGARPSYEEGRVRRALALFHNGSQYKFPFIVFDLEVMAEMLDRPIESILLATILKLTKFVALKSIFQLIDRPDIVKEFEKSEIDGVNYLLSNIETPDIIDRWNHCIISASHGIIDESKTKDILDNLANIEGLFDETTLLFTSFDIDGFRGDMTHAGTQLLNYNFLLAGADDQKRSDAIKSYMEYCLHGILAISEDGDGPHTSRLAEILPPYDV